MSGSVRKVLAFFLRLFVCYSLSIRPIICNELGSFQMLPSFCSEKEKIVTSIQKRSKFQSSFFVCVCESCVCVVWCYNLSRICSVSIWFWRSGLFTTIARHNTVGIFQIVIQMRKYVAQTQYKMELSTSKQQNEQEEDSHKCNRSPKRIIRCARNENEIQHKNTDDHQEKKAKLRSVTNNRALNVRIIPLRLKMDVLYNIIRCPFHERQSPLTVMPITFYLLRNDLNIKQTEWLFLYGQL